MIWIKTKRFGHSIMVEQDQCNDTTRRDQGEDDRYQRCLWISHLDKEGEDGNGTQYDGKTKCGQTNIQLVGKFHDPPPLK